MTQQQDPENYSRNIWSHLSVNTALQDLVLLADGKTQADWYARLLTEFALLSAGDDVVYAHSDATHDATRVRIVVFTSKLVLLADVDTTTAAPIASAFSRGELVGMTLGASERIDANGRRSYDWPGDLVITLSYRNQPKPVQIRANGAHRSRDKASAVVQLITGLTRDLADERMPSSQDQSAERDL